MIKITSENITQWKRIQDKEGGKNQSPYDGVWQHTDPLDPTKTTKYFIKKPAKSDFFAEWLAGRFFQKCIEHAYMPKEHQDSIVFSDLIQFADRSYALCQPYKDYITMGYNLTNSKSLFANDRSPFFEAIRGPSLYKSLVDGLAPQEYTGLAAALLWSLVVGAYSTHSANVFRRFDEILNIYVFGRFDWDDAWRNFGQELNTTCILDGYECTGATTARLTKNYMLNYTQISGLFTDIAEKAQQIMDKQYNWTQLFEEIFADTELPLDLFNTEELRIISGQLSIIELSSLQFGKINTAAATCFADIITARLQQISQIKDINPPPAPSQKLYQSLYVKSLVEEQPVIDQSPPDNVLPDVTTAPLTEILNSFCLSGDTTDFTRLDIEALKKRLEDHFFERINDGDRYNLWLTVGNKNVFAYLINDENNITGIDEYIRESELCRLIYTDNISPHPKYYKDYINGHSRFYPSLLDNFNSCRKNIITSLEQIKENKRISKSIDGLCIILQDQSKQFLQVLEDIGNFTKDKIAIDRANQEKIYVINNQQLQEMSGNKLLDLVRFLNDATHPNVGTIFSDDALRKKLKSAMDSNPDKKAALSKDVLTQLELYNKCLELIANQNQLDLDNLFNQASVTYKQLVPQLQQLMPGFVKTKAIYTKSKVDSFKKAVNTLKDTKIRVFPNLITIKFNEIPEDAREKSTELYQEAMAINNYFIAYEVYQEDFSQHKLDHLENYFNELKKYPYHKNLEQDHYKTICAKSLEHYPKVAITQSFFSAYEKLDADNKAGFQHRHRLLQESNKDNARLTSALAANTPFDFTETYAENLAKLNKIVPGTITNEEFSRIWNNITRFDQSTQTKLLAHLYPISLNINEQFWQALSTEALNEVISSCPNSFTSICQWCITKYKDMLDDRQLVHLFINLQTLLTVDEKKLFTHRHEIFTQIFADNDTIAELTIMAQGMTEAQAKDLDRLKKSPQIATTTALKQIWTNLYLLDDNSRDKLISQIEQPDLKLQQILATKTLKLDADAVADIISLHQFYTNHEKTNGYSKSMNAFYQEALSHRLASNASNEKKMENLLACAHKHFNHNHWLRRGFADAGIILGFFFGGAFIGLVRKYCFETSFLFSQAETNRFTLFRQEFADNSTLKVATPINRGP